MNNLLSILLLNTSLLFGYEVNQASSLLKKGDSCLNAASYSCAVQYYADIEWKGYQFNDEDLRMRFYLNYAEALYSTGDYGQAHIYYQKLKLLAVLNENRYYEGKAHTGIAHSLWRMTDNVNSIKEILASIAIFTELKDTSNLIVASNILAGIYVSVGKYNDAQTIYEDMLDLAIQTKDSSSIAGNFEYLGVINFYKGDFEEAIINYKKSLALNSKLNNSFARTINLSNLSEAYMELGEYQKALVILHEAEKLQKSYNFKSVLIFSYYTLGKIYSQLKSYDSAMLYYKKSLKLMDQTAENRDKHEVYRLIAQNFAERGDYKKAYEYHQMYSSQKDSLIDSERTRQLEEIKTKYEVENKIEENENLLIQNSEKQKELLAQKELIQLQYTIGVLIVIFLVISLLLAFKLYRVKQTLINSNNSKDKLFGIIAHDLKGPIGNIGVMLQLLEMEQNESMRTQYFHYLTQSIQNLSALTNQLLSWRFSQKGEFNFTIEKLPLREISDKTIDLFEFQLNEKKIKIVNSINSELYTLADENALLTIFRNLISNAIKFTKKGGFIKLEADPIDNYIEIKIQDSGIGMTSDAVQKVLEGRHLISSSGTDNEKGSGLGFSIVLEFVKKLKGKLNIISDGHTGTTVILKLQKP